MNTQNTNDLGKESVGKLLFKLSLPAITAQLINALYNIIDRMYIGRIPVYGSSALTGVGVAFPIIMVISAFSSLIGMGGAPLASIKLGGNDKKGAEKILGNCFSCLLILSLTLTLFFLVTKNKLLFMFGASNKTFTYANSYLTIYLLGTIFVQISLGLNSFINSQGFAKIGMSTVLIGAFLNIILDPIFIFSFKLGVKGAALATIISQAASAIWVLKFLFGRKTILKIRKENLYLNKKVILPILALGISPFIMQSTESLVQVTLNSGLQRYGGDQYVGAMTIISSIMQIILMPLMGLTQGAQPIISYNYGAKNYDRVKKAFKLLLTSALCFSMFAWALAMFVPKLLIVIFATDPKLINVTTWAIRIFLCGILFFGAQIACQNTFIALGEAKVSLFLALLRKIILLIPLAIILPKFLNVKGIFIAEPISDILATLTTCTVFYFKSKKLFPKELDIKNN